MIKTIIPTPLDLEIVIEWPVSSGPSVVSKQVAIYESKSREMITTISAMTIHCAVTASLVWAEVEMYADLDGNPILTGNPVISNNEIVTKVFTAYVTQMLSKTSYREAYTLGAMGAPMRDGPIHKEAKT